MKKILALTLAIMMVAALCLTANAATGINDNEQAVLDKLSATYEAGDWSFSVPAEYVNSAKNYFASSCDMTAEEKTAILDCISKGIALIKKEASEELFKDNVLHLSVLSDAATSEILDLGVAACAEVDLVLTYSPSTRQVTITNASGTPVFKNDPIVKTTGEDFPITATVIGSVVVIAMIASTAALFIVSKKNGLLVK